MFLYRVKYLILFFLSFISGMLLAQNEYSKWYFGYYAALDFMQNPPTPLNNSAMFAVEGCASIADDSGNLLFYTDGATVYNQQHAIMANGTGLLGDATPVQSSIIIKQPNSSNLYYVFTMRGAGLPEGLNYSIVDMNLAAGMGSVTVKNAPIYNASCIESLHATKHGNNTDYWVVIHEINTNNFRAYLLTATGVNTTAVISSVGEVVNGIVSAIKISPTGNKMGSNSVAKAKLYDFNKSTGVVSNELILASSGVETFEFSYDGSKFYAKNSVVGLIQWNVQAGSALSVLSSSVVISSNQPVFWRKMQLAPDRKIYIIGCCSPSMSYSLSVINNPNVSGLGCNLVPHQQNISVLNTVINDSSGNFSELPNIIITSSCAITFTAQSSNVLCNGANTGSISITDVSGAFGIPTYSWSNGTTNLATAQINNLSAGNWSITVTDTLGCSAYSVITITEPTTPINFSLSVSNSTICPTSSVVLTATASGGVGNFTYTWQNSTVGNTYTTNPSTPSVYTATATDSNNCSVSNTIAVYVPILQVSVTPNSTLACLNSTLHLTANSTNSNTTYTWLPSNNTGNQLLVNANSLQNQTYTVIASLNSCTASAVATVSVLPLPTAQIQVLKKGVCVNDSIALKGIGGNSYSWLLPNGENYVGETLRIKSLSGIYTLMVRDEHLCANTATQNVILNPAPTGVINANSFEGCVPFCNDYVFVPSNLQTHSLATVAWQTDNKIFSGNSINYCFNTVGTHTIHANIKDQNDCTNSFVAEVNVYPKPKAEFTYSPKEPFEQDEITFSNTSEGAKYFYWNVSVIDETSQEKNLKLRFENPGVYVTALIAQNDKLCMDTAIKTIHVKPELSIYVPNVFSPNGDNLNDVFKPVTRGTFEYRFFVFDYWGQKIFDTKDTNAGWDGTFKGEDCKVGVYVWKLVIVSSKEEKEFAGSVLLER